MREFPLGACRALFAASRSAGEQASRLGEVTLFPHQAQAAARVRAALDVHRGCLLADDVGRGKTYVAIAVASRWAQPLVVVPASVRATWLGAMRRAGVAYPLWTHESLSRGAVPGWEPDGVVVDESHHFRNPATRRHAVLADLVARAEVLLLSATPVQNRTTDLAAQLSLYLGSAAYRLHPERLARYVVRAVARDGGDTLPRITPPRWVRPRTDDAAVVRAILALPPPPRALDAGDAGALRTISLVRAWSSSRAALSAAIARRRRLATALEQCLEAGRVPTVAELRSWTGDDSVQLGFAPLLVGHRECEQGIAALMDVVRAEQDALAALARRLRVVPLVDAARADALLEIARAHPGERVLAFSSFAATARAYHSLLLGRAQTGLLTASGAWIASGRVARRELLERFAPLAQGRTEAPAHEQVRLLLCTDLLSEGVNLQDASVVVHLDLPWNPARLAQRVGRVRRPLGASATVSTYLLAPPADAELLLDVEARLRRKLALAQRSIGGGLAVVPALAPGSVEAACEDDEGLASLIGKVQSRIHSWSNVTTPTTSPAAAASCAPQRGWLALLADGRLVVCVDGSTGDDPRLLDTATAAAEGDARALGEDELASAERALAAYLASERVMRECGAGELASPVARAVENRAQRLLREQPRHDRTRLMACAKALRHALARHLSLGTERRLQRLLAPGERTSADGWLTRALATLPLPAPSPSGGSAAPSDAVRAIITFGP